MQKVVVCCKWVLDDADIRVGSDGLVDFSRAKGCISEYDRNAIAAACDLAGQLEGAAVGLSFGNDESSPVVKDALSRGLEEMYWVHGPEADTADGLVTADCLSNAIRQIEDTVIVVCAEGASDTFARQTAPRIAAKLHIPVVTSVSEAHIEDGKLIVKRRLEDCSETVEVQLPAVLGVLPEAAEAPIPGLKAIMAAKKKPMTELSASDMRGNQTEGACREELRGLTVDRKTICISEDTPEETVRALVAALRKEGVLQ